MAEKEIWEIALTKPAEKVYDKANKETRRRLDGCFEKLEKKSITRQQYKASYGRA